MQANEQRIEAHIENLRQFTATPGEGVTRLTYSVEDLKARNYIKEQMTAYGLTVSEDGFGNIFGKLNGMLEDAPSVLIGSHFDSVPNGGAYDGTAGVVVALEVAAMFQAQNLTPTYPLEVVAMIEEEGGRFQGGLMGSRAMLGVLSAEDFAAQTDVAGITTIEAMEAIGLNPLNAKPRPVETIKAFLELHIEQGPILEEKEISIGVVESIVGLCQLELTIQGQAGHAGTTPMNRRKDALVAAAKIIAELPNIAVNESHHTVITTGRLQLYPNGANVIPEKVVFSVDIRSNEEVHVKNAVEQVKACILREHKNGISTNIAQLMYISPKELNHEIRDLFKQTSEKLAIPYCSMHSGAGHDAMVLSDFTASGMIFVPSKDGLSHCPEEYTKTEDFVKGTNILFEVTKQLTEAVEV